MLEMLAIAREDGWAYVRTNRGIRLVRPPYMLGNSSSGDEQSVEKAVLHAGFVALRKEFNDWNSLIVFLNQQVVQSRLEQGKKIPEIGPGPEILALAPKEQLVSFLNRIEQELIPNRAWEHAENVLLGMLVLKNVCGDEQLVQRATTLLRGVLNARKEGEQLMLRLAWEDSDLSKIFPHAVNKYGDRSINEYAQYIAKRRQILAFA